MTKGAYEDQLMRQAAAGNRVAMDRLYHELATPLYNYLLRLADDTEQADDALQATFLNAWRGRATFRGQGVRPWLFVIARNAAFSLRRRKPEFEIIDDSPVAAGPADEHEATELAQRLDAVLARLPADTRETIVLSRVSGLNLDEIADLLGTSNGAVRVRLSRGLKRLKEELDS